MYPAQALADGLYTAADLPDAITLLGVGSLAKSGTAYGNTTNGVILEGGVWARYLSGVRATKACLIDGNGNFTPGDDTVEDQFASSYSVDVGEFSGFPGPITVFRRTLCNWQGGINIPPDGEYCTEGLYVWRVSLFYNTLQDCFVVQYQRGYCEYSGGTLVETIDIFGIASKLDGENSSPVGDYYDSLLFLVATVS
jgi:hypothetical protein